MPNPLETKGRSRRQQKGEAAQILLFFGSTIVGGSTIIYIASSGMAPAWRGITSQQHQEQEINSQISIQGEPLSQPEHRVKEFPGLPYGAFLDLRDGKPVVSEHPILFAMTVFSEDGLVPIFAGEDRAYAGSFSLEVVRARHGIPLFGIPKLPDDMLDTTRVVPLTTGGMTIVGNVLILLTNERGHPVAPDGTLLTKPNAPNYFVDLGNVKEARRLA